MEINIEMPPTAFDFAMDDSPWVLGDGGRGSVKSTALCLGAYVRAKTPGAVEFMCRQKLIDFRTTTLINLIEGVGKMPPVIPPGTYDHNQSTKTISIHGGGKIIYNGLDQGDVGRTMGSTGKASSLNASGAHFDECVEMEEAAVIQVCMGVRVKLPGLALVRKFACNPGLPSSWPARRWGLAQGHKIMKNHVRYQLKPQDNWHLPPEYIEELKALDGIARERYWLGKWVGSDGMVFDRFNRDVHVQTMTKNWKGQVLGVDDGYTDPFVILDIRYDSDGRHHIAREVYETKLIQTEKIARVKALWNGEGTVVVDSAEPDLIESMRRAGINAVAADKGQGSIEFGINIVQTELAVEDDGMPRLTVDPSCTNTIREFESYERNPITDKPRDRDNHTMDGVRYALRYRLQERGGRVVSTFGEEPDKVDAENKPAITFQQMRDEDPNWGFR